MTAQVPERLLYQGEQFQLCTEPLESYLSQFKSRPNFPQVNTSCRRRYVGYWEIIDNQLYLVDILIGGIKWRSDMRSDERELAEEQRMFHDEWVTPETIFLGQSLPIFASWYSGIMRCGQGKVVDYVNAGYATTYEHELLIMVENGVVIGKPVVSSSNRM